MKQTLTTALVLVLVAAAGFAGGRSAQVTRIGILMAGSLPAFDEVERGIQDELAALGHTGIAYDRQIADGDPPAAVGAWFQADRVGLAVGIGAPASRALAAAMSDIPVVFTAVIDPVGAGLVPSLAGGGGNVAGLSSRAPVRQQIELLTQLATVRRLGHVHSSVDTDAAALARMAAQVCDELGIEFVAVSVTDAEEVGQAARSILDRVDAFYVGTDSTGLASLIEAALEAGLPVVSADPTAARTLDVLLAYGFDHYEMGRATGWLIARVLAGENPDSIPVQFPTGAGDLVLHLNLDVAGRLGIVVSPALLEAADRVIENGVLTERR